MERIDRQQRSIKTPISAVSDGHLGPLREPRAGQADAHWLSHAMAMWIAQNDTLCAAEGESRCADPGRC